MCLLHRSADSVTIDGKAKQRQRHCWLDSPSSLSLSFSFLSVCVTRLIDVAREVRLHRMSHLDDINNQTCCLVPSDTHSHISHVVLVRDGEGKSANLAKACLLKTDSIRLIEASTLLWQLLTLPSFHSCLGEKRSSLCLLARSRRDQLLRIPQPGCQGWN